SRLAALLLVVVTLPLIAGGVAIERMARAQSLRDADLALQVASLTATQEIRQQYDSVARTVSAPFAVSAYGARDTSMLDTVRASAGLDYLIVTKAGRPAMASIALPEAVDQGAAAIDRGALRPVAAEHRVVIRNQPSASVLGGRLWRVTPNSDL